LIALAFFFGFYGFRTRSQNDDNSCINEVIVYEGITGCLTLCAGEINNGSLLFGKLALSGDNCNSIRFGCRTRRCTLSIMRQARRPRVDMAVELSNTLSCAGVLKDAPHMV